MTDIHGNYDAMVQLFDFAGLDPSNDELVIGGDMIDRGPDSGKVLKGLKLLQQMYPQNLKALIGNHEQMMLDYYRNQDPLWKTYGGNEAIASFEQVFDGAQLDSYLLWIDQLPIVYETDQYIFTHAGIDPDDPLHRQNRDVLWMNRKEFNSRVDLQSLQQLTKGRVVVHGHTPGSAVAFDGVRLNCDLGSGVFPKHMAALALVDLTHDQYYRYSFRNQKIRIHKVDYEIR